METLALGMSCLGSLPSTASQCGVPPLSLLSLYSLCPGKRHNRLFDLCLLTSLLCPSQGLEWQEHSGNHVNSVPFKDNWDHTFGFLSILSFKISRPLIHFYPFSGWDWEQGHVF